MQSHLIFHKTGNQNKLQVLTFQAHRLSSFSAIKQTVTGVEEGTGEGGCKFFLFLPLFLSAHINSQYKLNSHKSIFIITVNTYFFHLKVHCFF